MSKEKQIEEMAEVLRHSCEGECFKNEDGFVDCEACEACILYEAGYRKQSGWISVEEMLPEESGEYLTWHNGYFHLIEYNAELHGWNISHHADRSTEIKSVTHWMPLPEPPKEREPDCRDCRYFVGCECFSGTPCCDLSKEENRKDDTQTLHGV